MNLHEYVEQITPSIQKLKPRIVKRPSGLYLCETDITSHQGVRVIRCGFGMTATDAYDEWLTNGPIAISQKA